MQTTAKAERKVISQFITVYQAILSFSIEKIGLEVIMKFNKKDPDDMLDSVNSKLIEMCDEYLATHKLGLDKYQLATICMDLITQTLSSLDEPFRVTIKESKHLIQDYLEKNKSKREALERIKAENETLDKEILAQQRVQREKKVNLVEKPEMPTEIPEVGTMGSIPPTPKPKKRVAKGTDSLAIDNFVLPKY